MSDYLPVQEPGKAITLTTSAAVTGGQLVAISGSGTIAPAAAGSTKVVGVAAQDTASGAQVTVYARGTVHESTTSGAVTAGDELVSAAGGKVSTLAAAAGATAADINNARAVLGFALYTAADAALVQWMEH